MTKTAHQRIWMSKSHCSIETRVMWHIRFHSKHRFLCVFNLIGNFQQYAFDEKCIALSKSRVISSHFLKSIRKINTNYVFAFIAFTWHITRIQYMSHSHIVSICIVVMSSSSWMKNGILWPRSFLHRTISVAIFSIFSRFWSLLTCFWTSASLSAILLVFYFSHWISYINESSRRKKKWWKKNRLVSTVFTIGEFSFGKNNLVHFVTTFNSSKEKLNFIGIKSNGKWY